MVKYTRSRSDERDSSLASPQTKFSIQVVRLRPDIENIHQAEIVVNLPDKAKIDIQPDTEEARMSFQFSGIRWTWLHAQIEDATPG